MGFIAEDTTEMMNLPRLKKKNGNWLPKLSIVIVMNVNKTKTKI